jgi:glycyl-tRNA synthetase
MEHFERWKQARLDWHLSLGLDRDRLEFHQHSEKELAHYARAAFDINFDFGGTLGFQEIEGVHNRSDFDLKQHQEFSTKKLEYVDQAANKRYLPYVIETSVGADRVTLAIMVNALREEAVPGETEGRTVMGFHPALAPIKAGVFPLTKKDGQPEMAEKLGAALRKKFNVFYDEAGAIGRRYRRQDEAGTPFGITIDGDSTQNNDVTIRFRDNMGQIRVSTDQVVDVLTKYLEADHKTADSTLVG